MSDREAFASDGEMAAFIGSHDWTSSPLGPPQAWPQRLWSILDLMLTSKFPMLMAWGPRLACLYNDAYASLLGDKHPSALGKPLEDVWSEVWDDLQPLVEQTFAGEPFYSEDLPLQVRRKGFEEEAWFTFSYSPVRDEEEKIAGLFCVCKETTQKVLAKRHLAAEGERLRELFDEAPGFMAVVRGPNHVYEMANKAFLDLVGRDNLIGNPVGQAVPELAAQGIAELLDQVYRTGERFAGYRMPLKLQRQPGVPLEERFVTFVLQPLRDPDGSISGIFAQGQDVTEGQRALVALGRSEAHLARAQQVAALGSWELDLKTNQLTWSDQTYRLYGFDRSEFEPTYEKVISLFHEEDRPEVEAHLQHVLAERVPLDIAARFLRSDGKVRWGAFAANLLLGEDGTPESLVGAIQDITDRRESELTLRDSEVQARAVIEASLDAFIRLDEGGRIIEWSRQAESLFGWSRLEAIGRSLADLVVPEDLRGAHKAGIDRHRNSPQAQLNLRTQVEAQNRSGDLFPVELTVISTKWQGKTVFNGFVRDIRERLAAEERLRHSQKMEAIGQLTGGVAHDFNNLLAITIGNLDVLEDQATLTGEAKELLEAARDAALRGADLTGRLLAFSRQQTLQPRSTNVNALTAEYAKLLARILGADIDLRLDLASDLWEATADRGQLEAAITNLATNARDAMPKGGQLTISTRNERLDSSYADTHQEVAAGDYVAVEVSDTGHGMSRQVRERAFEPFYTTKEEGKGTGLGLSMVFGFAKQSGGHIRIYSEVGQGTTVSLLLPRAEAAVEEEAVAKPTLPRAKAGENLLVVEDDPNLRRLAGIQLRSLGYQVVEAEDGPSAMEVLESDAEIDLLLTDIVMPGGLNGVELGRRARDQRPRLKLLYMSGFPQSAFGERAQLDTDVILVRKPFRQAELAAKVRTALDLGQT